jgi:hypothetical protein
MMKREDNLVGSTIEIGGNITGLKQPGTELLTCCPTRGERAIGTDFKQFAVPGGQAMWWRCSVCQRWHVMILATRQQ